MAKLKKLITLAAASALACCALAFVGCSSEPSPEEQVTEHLTQQLNKMKSPDLEAAEELEATEGCCTPYEFDYYDIDITEFLASFLDGFDYTIDEVITKDDLIKVNTTITYKKYPDFENEFSEMLDAAIFEANTSETPITDQELDGMIHDGILEILEETATPTTESFTFIYKKFAEGSYANTFSALYEVTEKAFE